MPFLDLGGSPGRDIRTGNAVENAEEVMQEARTAGENLAKTADYLVVGESIPGGTTTALGILLAMGVDAREKVSSSMPGNPHELKIKTVKAGLKASGVKFGALADDPIKAISCVGDPMVPAFAGLVIGAAGKVPVLMAGGTQMGAVLPVVNALNPNVLDKLAMVIMAWVGRSAHKGMNTYFVNAMHGQYRNLRLVVALFIAFVIAIYLLRVVGFTAVIAGPAVALVLTGNSKRHFKGVTGDVFGAGNELARLASLIAILAVVRWA